MMVHQTMHSESFHETCFACGDENISGLNLRFNHTAAVSTCTTSIPAAFQSYSGVMHGGIVATLMDAAMVRCLQNKFDQDPFTCRLAIRYIMSIPTDQEITLNASFIRRRGEMCWAVAEILYKGKTCATAEATFKLLRPVHHSGTIHSNIPQEKP